jgi:tripartite-type tricarboxylate transporter receptor subunit TctC
MLHKILSVALATLLTVSGYASAADKEIDVLMRSKPGGNAERLVDMMVDSLTKQGYTVNKVTLGSCSGLKQYMKKETTRPGLFMTSDMAINEHRNKGCDLTPNSNTEVLGVMFSRKNTICGPVGTTPESLVAKFRAGNVNAIRIAGPTSMPTKMIESIGETLGRKVKHVPYGGTGGSIRGVLGGDADFIFAGLTPKVDANKKLSCVGHSSDANIPGKKQFAELFPGYSYSNVNAIYFAQGVNVTPALQAELSQAVTKAMQDDTWTAYVKKSTMVPATELTHVTVQDVVDNIKNWQ